MENKNIIINQITEMLYLQSSFNSNVINNWELESLEWSNAIFVESSEAIDSLQWKWWKWKWSLVISQ